MSSTLHNSKNNSDETKNAEFEKQVKQVLNKERILGWSIGMKSMAQTVIDKLKGFDDKDYILKTRAINDVLRYCNWVLGDEKLADTMEQSVNNIENNKEKNK